MIIVGRNRATCAIDPRFMRLSLEYVARPRRWNASAAAVLRVRVNPTLSP